MTAKWYSLSVHQTLATLETDPRTGLDRTKVRARRQKRGANDIFAPRRQTYLSYLSHLLTDIPTILLLLTILIAVVFESRTTLLAALAIMVLHFIGAVTGYVRAQRVLEGLGDRALPAAKVMREGRLFLIKQKHLVQGDIIFLSGGDIVPCDARLIESEEAMVLETNLTSVQGAVPKDASFSGYGDLPPAAQQNMVFASTVFTAGTAKAVVCEVGADTLVCKMDKNKPIVTREDLQLPTTLSRISRVLSVLMMVTIFLLTVVQLLFAPGGESRLFDTFLTALSLSVASMCEYYMPFALLIIACGIYGSVRRYRSVSSGAMIKDIGKLDRLREVDCLILPMRGVFTASSHQPDAVYTGNDLFEIDHRSFAKYATRTVRFALLSTGLYGAQALRANNLSGNNVYTPEETAIIRASEEAGIYNVTLERDYPLLDHRGIGRLNGIETSICRHGEENLLAVRGGVKEILSLCSRYCLDGRIYPLDQRVRSELVSAAASMAKRSCRVIAVASGQTEYSRIVRPEHLHTDLIFEGFLSIREPILPDAARTLQRFAELGIDVLVTADDEDEDRVALARALGLIEDRDQVITGSAMRSMKEGIFRVNAGRYRLFVGLSIAQKRLLIRSMHDQGKTVGVLAHELDEIVLYRDAEVGFAGSLTIAEGGSKQGVDMTSRQIPVFDRLGKNRIGSCEALKFVADVIVSEADAGGDGGINAIFRALMTARNIFANLHHAIRYLLATQIARLALVLLSFALDLWQMTPVQILYTGLVVDFFAVLMIAFSGTGGGVPPMTHPDRERSSLSLLRPHLPFALLGLVFAGVCSVYPRLLALLGVRLTEEQGATAIFYLFLMTQWAVLYASTLRGGIREGTLRINRITLLSILAETVVLALCILLPSFGRWLDCAPLPLPVLLATAVFPLILTIFALLLRRNGKESDKH